MNFQNQAEVVSVGTELLMGETVDTNAGYLAGELHLLGIRLGRTTVVGDEREQLCEVLRQALERAPLVLVSGGLGPTEDDLTRESLAAVLGEEMYVDGGMLERLRALFARTGREMPPHNIKQAMLIPSAVWLPNPLGTAPGWWVQKGGKSIAVLPGPPRELKPMWQNEVKPRLLAEFPDREIATLTLKTYGLPEAKVSQMATPLCESDNPALGIYARADGIHLRLIAHGDDCRRLLNRAEQQLREIFAHHIWGREDEDLADIVGGLLVERAETLATMEDGSRGLVAGAVTGAERAREYYRGGLVARSVEMLADWGVPPETVAAHGAISAEVAAAMAIAARDRFSSHIGLSTTGIVGLDQDGESPGLAFIGFADAGGGISWRHSFPPYPDVARDRLAVAALFRLRRHLLEVDP